jgi:hypothetical protein
MMSIQKKSLISALKTAKKANVASTGEVDTKGGRVASMRLFSNRKAINAKNVLNGKSTASTKTAF